MIHPKHLHPARHIFHGHASGVSAHIRRPHDRILAVQGGVSLPVIGGHADYQAGPTTLDKWLQFESVSTAAHGDYVDAAAGVGTTRGEVPFHTAATETRVTAKVTGLVILRRLHVDQLSIGLISRSAPGSPQPPIRLEGNSISGVRIDNSKLKIVLAEDFYCDHDTRDKLAAAHGSGLPDHHARMFLPSVDGAEEVTTFPEANGVVKCTIVQDITWDGPPHPNATIHGHVVVVPNFGKIYFGEMFLTAGSRRITMVRCQLGSDDGGEVAAGEGETNGQTFPPTGG